MDRMNTTLNYGNLEFKGTWATTKAFFNQNSDGLDVPAFEFFYIVDTIAGVLDEQIQGVIGMARPGQKIKLNSAETPDTGKKMFLEGIQDLDKTFSLRFSSDHFSWIDVGKPSENIVGDFTSDEYKLRTYDDFFWSMGVQGVRFNG